MVVEQEYLFMNIAKLTFMALCLAFGLACTSSPAAPPSTVAAAEPASTAAPVNAAATAQGKEFLASGPIIVENQVDVAAQRDGVIAKVLVDVDAFVKKGQLLAQLDDRQISADLEAARAKTRSTENDLKNWEAEAKVLEVDHERAERMWEAQIISKEQLDHAKYKSESDQWDVKRVSELLANAQDVEHSLELELEKTRVAAPFDGVVARRYIRVGQSVSRSDRLFWVTAVAPLRIRVTLPEKFLGHIKPGTIVGITPAEELDSSRRYSARVIAVSPVVDPSSDTIEILAELSGSTAGLRPGMRADVHILNMP
jgi:membrane fusion protein, multidrug efflux system